MTFLKKHLQLVLIFSFLSIHTIWADENKIVPPAQIKVKLKVASNYVSKGTDKFSNYAHQKQKSYGSHTGALLFQPTLTYLAPEPGLFFKMQGYFAMDGRKDQDVDQLIQKGPGGDDILYKAGGFEGQKQAWVTNSGFVDSLGQPNDLTTIMNETLADPKCRDSKTCIPKYYKEENGLFRNEEMKLYLGYKRKSTIGKFSFALKFTVPVSKQANRTVSKAVIFDYSLPKLKQLIFYSEHTQKKSVNYYQLKWVDKVTLTQFYNNDFKLEYMAGVGYGVKSHLQGFQDVTGRVGAWYEGFSIGANISWRPDLRFHDKDYVGTDSDRLPIWVAGESSRADGKVADPSRLYGHYNHLVNQAIQEQFAPVNIAPGYTYTPRQSLPRYLVWIDFSYTFKIK